jgi:hypothetical protein
LNVYSRFLESRAEQSMRTKHLSNTSRNLGGCRPRANLELHRLNTFYRDVGQGLSLQI